MQIKLLFLGTGASSGVPVIACSCAVCSSPYPRNKRLRPAALLFCDDLRILIDAGPDLRAQALAHRISHLDGVIFTHTHYDHIGGLDDLRVYYVEQGAPLPCLVSKQADREIRTRCPYLFQPIEMQHSLTAQLELHVLEEKFGPVIFKGISWHIVSYLQGNQEVIGFRVGDLGFVSDIKEYSPRVIEELKGVKRLVVSALRNAPSHVHFSIADAITFSRAVGAEVTYLTHLSHDVDHFIVSQQLPTDVFLAYDGLEI
jgi:phosphoribosyl 1,2-cyclic phosphate phosphodiesterase